MALSIHGKTHINPPQTLVASARQRGDYIENPDKTGIETVEPDLHIGSQQETALVA